MIKVLIRGLLFTFIFLFGVEIFAQNSVKANFGSYPADYSIAYFNTMGFPKPISVKNLFGPNVKFATTFQGVPATVTLESSSGTKNEFTATLLLSIKNLDTGVFVKSLRMQVTFQSDSLTEMSYTRHVKIANLMNGQISEQLSRGSQLEDGRVFGLFAGMLEYFWDKSILSK